MPTSAEIVRVLNLKQSSTDVFTGSSPRQTTLSKLYGGHLFGQALAAAARTVAPGRPAHVFQAFCLAPGSTTEPIRYQVDRVRDGRSFSARAVSATQGEREVLRAMVSFHVPEPGFEHASPMPSVPGPEELPSFQDVIRDHSHLPDEPWRAEWEGLELRYVDGGLATPRSDQPGHQQFWIRACDEVPDDPQLHGQILTYLSDIGLINTALLPHGIVMGTPELPRATLTHSVWLHAPFRADEWLLVDQHSPRATGARGLARAEVFTIPGTHVATYTQEGLIRPGGSLRDRLVGG